MILGLLPEIRGGLGELARTGQHSRFVEGYLRPYARAFDEVRYFSYLGESLERYTDDAELRARVRIFSGGRRHPWLHTLAMPIRYRRELRECSVLRVFQVTGVVPALIAKRWFGVPFVTTYGFWYSKLTRSAVTGSLGRVVAALGLRVADAVIVPTQELAAHVGRWVPDPAAIHMIPNGVDTSRFPPGGSRDAGGAEDPLRGPPVAREEPSRRWSPPSPSSPAASSSGSPWSASAALRERLERMAGELGVSLEGRPVRRSPDAARDLHVGRRVRAAVLDRRALEGSCSRR